MNCNGCLNLNGLKCKLGKQDLLGYLSDNDGKILQLNYDCIFKNTEHPNISFDMAHKFGMARVAIATYFKVDSLEQLDTLYKILDKEKEYGAENLIGQFNVLIKAKISLREIQDLSKKMATYNGKRLWNVKVIMDEQSYLDYMLNTCTLPYAYELKEPDDLATIQNFKFKCFSGPVPELYEGITSVKWLRKEIERKYEVQEQNPIQYNI